MNKDEFTLNFDSSLENLESLSKTSSSYNDISPLNTANFNLNLPGIDSLKSINFLFSPSIDKIMDLMLDLCINGKFDQILDKLNVIVNSMSNMGVGSGLFNGPIGTTVVNSIKNSVESIKFQKTSSKLKKVRIILKNLEKQIKYYKDPVIKEKYENAIYSIKSLIKIFATIYRNRKIVNDKVLKGVGNIVFESREELKENSINKVTF